MFSLFCRGYLLLFMVYVMQTGLQYIFTGGITGAKRERGLAGLEFFAKNYIISTKPPPPHPKRPQVCFLHQLTPFELFILIYPILFSIQFQIHGDIKKRTRISGI
jgi:hypothetical protein